MAIVLEKGSRINLEKNFGGGLKKVSFLIDWDSNYDMDIQASILKDGKALNEKDFVFYHNLKDSTDSIIHSGDVQNGQLNAIGTEDETISIDLEKLSASLPDRNEVLLTASLYDAVKLGIDFSDIGAVTCRVFNTETREELMNYRLDKDNVGDICNKVARFVKVDGKWEFEVLNASINSLEELLIEIGLM